MHRILLYALVVGLLYLAWDARRAAVLAAAEAPAESHGAAHTEESPVRVAPARAHPRHGLQGRLEARIDDRPASVEEAELARAPRNLGEPAPLEAWLESPGLGDARIGSGIDPRMGRDARASGAGERDDASDEGEPRTPVVLESLARIECLDGRQPAWCGTLDLALEPVDGAELRPEPAGEGFEWVETAWIGDESGRLLARVAALDGLGLMLDPTWPWLPRARQLQWGARGPIGLGSRQYRLVLEGRGPGPAWSGRLLLIPQRVRAR